MGLRKTFVISYRIICHMLIARALLSKEMGVIFIPQVHTTLALYKEWLLFKYILTSLKTPRLFILQDKKISNLSLILFLLHYTQEASLAAVSLLLKHTSSGAFLNNILLNFSLWNLNILRRAHLFALRKNLPFLIPMHKGWAKTKHTKKLYPEKK